MQKLQNDFAHNTYQ